MSFMGIKLKSYDEDNEHWDIKPELRSQGELRSAYQSVTASMTTLNYTAVIDKALRALPEYARDLVDWLIEDRIDSTNNEKYARQWSVVAVRPREKHAYHSSKKLIKSVNNSDWLIMIRGETMGKVDRRRPGRWDDPWRKSSPRRYYPRHHGRYDEREYNQHRQHYEEYNEYSRRQPVSIMPASEADEEDVDVLDGTFVSGMVNVGLFSSQEDAEKRMDKVLDDMAGEVTA